MSTTELIAFDAEFTANGELTSQHFTILEKVGIVPVGTPPEMISYFAYVCKEKGLSPFSKEIYLLPFKERQADGSYKTNYSVITGIDGYRKIAHATGTFAGRDPQVFDRQADGSFKTLAQLMKEGGVKDNTVCEVTIYKVVAGVRCPFVVPVIFKNYNTGKSKWATTPEHMISKVAEAASLRAAFPRETSGIRTEEEFGAVAGETITEIQADANMNDRLKPGAASKTEAEVIQTHKEKIEALATSDDVREYWKSLTWGGENGKPNSTVYIQVQHFCIQRGQALKQTETWNALTGGMTDAENETIDVTRAVLANYKTSSEVDAYYDETDWGEEKAPLRLAIKYLCDARKKELPAQGGGKP